MIRKTLLVSVFSVLLIAAFAAVAGAQDSIYISEPTVVDMPKILPRYDASLWNMDFRDNPALL